MSAVQIYKSENDKYHVDFPAIEQILNKAKNNFVAIYSLSGPLRTGKSFMLGFFLRYLESKGEKDWITNNLQSTFTFKGGSRRDTTGIWMWSEPFLIEKKDGTKVSVFLIDTQGCFDSQTTTQDNAIIFALSTLLSSVIIFNIKGQISEEILQFLQYFAGFARLADEENKDEPFQKLLFLVRDWQFSDYDHGYYDDDTSKNEKNFKKDHLDPKSDQPREIKFTHEMILSTFQDISCYLLPYPGSEVAQNRNLDVSKMEDNFLKCLREFVPLVLDNESIVVKKFSGNCVTGEQLIKFAQRWAELFNSDKIPESKTFFQATTEIQCEIAKTAAIENYTRKMKDLATGSDRYTDKEFETSHQ